MSTIQIIPLAAGQNGKGFRTDNKIAPAPPTDKPRASDRQMTHAWSIGVTNAGRSQSGPSAPKESCPPEVYIG